LEEGVGSGSKNSSGDINHHATTAVVGVGGGSKQQQSLLDSMAANTNSSDDKGIGIGIRPGIVGSSTAAPFAPGRSNSNSISGVGEDQGGGLLHGLKLRLPGHDNTAASSSSSSSSVMMQQQQQLMHQQGMHMLPGELQYTDDDGSFRAHSTIPSPPQRLLKCVPTSTPLHSSCLPCLFSINCHC